MSDFHKPMGGFKASLQKGANPERPSQSPAPSQASNASTSTNDLKRKRPEEAFSQPLDTGTGNTLPVQVVYAKDFLRENEKAYKLDEILSYLSLSNHDKAYKNRIAHTLRAVDKILYDRTMDTYAYRAFHDIRSAEGLLKFLQDQPTAQGIDVKKLKDGWKAAEDAVNKLESQGKVMAIRNKKDHHAKMVWLDDPSLKFMVDDEFKAMWQQIKVPDAAAVATALQKERLVPASKIQLVKKVAKAPEKKKKKARQGGKVTNKHMVGVLKDYSHLKK